MRYAVIIGQREDRTVAAVSEVGDRRALKTKFDELSRGKSEFAELQLCTLSRVKRHRFKGAAAPQSDSVDEDDSRRDAEADDSGAADPKSADNLEGSPLLPAKTVGKPSKKPADA